MTQLIIERRSLIAGGVALLGSLACPSLALASPNALRLRMHNSRTGQNFNKIIFDGKNFRPDALKEFNWFARDWRQNKAANMDPAALKIAAQLQEIVGNRELLLISGYRTPNTNKNIKGTAKNSYHMKGMAFDIMAHGVSTNSLYRGAMRIRGGGVGKYSRQSFVHIDSGPPRTWGT